MAKITQAKQITDRDRNILTDLARCRVLSANQIKNEYWPEAKERTMLERLERLEKGGYIKEQTIPAEKAGQYLKVYCLGEKGKKWATGPEGPGMDRSMVFTHHGKFNEILHQVWTNSVYYRLTDNEKATFKIGDVIEIERKVSKGGGGIEIPDAIFTNDDGDEIFVEADVGSYTGKQIKQKVSSFVDKKTIWVCPAGKKGFLAKHGAKGEFFTYSTAS